jgi:hypothetical protein
MAAADYLLLRIAIRHNAGTSAVSGSSFSTLKAPDVFPERAAMEDFRQILVLKASTSLQHTLLVADDTAGTSLQPTTTGNTPHFATTERTRVPLKEMHPIAPQRRPHPPGFMHLCRLVLTRSRAPECPTKQTTFWPIWPSW